MLEVDVLERDCLGSITDTRGLKLQVRRPIDHGQAC